MPASSSCLVKSIDQYTLINDDLWNFNTDLTIWNPLFSYSYSWIHGLTRRYSTGPITLSRDVVHLDTPPRRTFRSRRRAQDTISVITDVQLLRVSQNLRSHFFDLFRGSIVRPMRFGWMGFASDGIGAQRSCSDGGSVSNLAVKRSKSARDSCLLTNAYPFRAFSED